MIYVFLWSMRTGCILRALINLLLQAALADKELKPVINKKQPYNSASNSLEGQQPPEGDKNEAKEKKEGMKKQHSHGKELKQ